MFLGFIILSFVCIVAYCLLFSVDALNAMSSGFMSSHTLECLLILGRRVCSAGYRPIATCSPNHMSLLQSLGAVSTFDYNSPSCASTIRAETSNRVRYVLDCIADTASVQLCYTAMSRAGGRYTCLELPSASSLEARKAVSWRFVMGYEVFGREIALGNGYGRDGKDGVEHHQRAARWAEEVQGLVTGGWLKGHAVEVIGGRWEESVPWGLERLKRGNARGVKLVAKITAD